MEQQKKQARDIIVEKDLHSTVSTQKEKKQDLYGSLMAIIHISHLVYKHPNTMFSNVDIL